MSEKPKVLSKGRSVKKDDAQSDHEQAKAPDTKTGHAEPGAHSHPVESIHEVVRKVTSYTTPPTPSRVLTLQRAIGNRATHRLISQTTHTETPKPVRPSTLASGNPGASLISNLPSPAGSAPLALPNSIYTTSRPMAPAAAPPDPPNKPPMQIWRMTDISRQRFTTGIGAENAELRRSTKVQRKIQPTSGNQQSESATKPSTGSAVDKPDAQSIPVANRPDNDELVRTQNEHCAQIERMVRFSQPAEGIYRALMTFSPGERVTMEGRYEFMFQQSLAGRLKGYGPDEFAIRALATLRHGSDNVKHCKLALILMANVGKASSVIDVLKGMKSVSTRQSVRVLYEDVYSGMGNRSLEGDIRALMQGLLADWEAEQAIALLDRNLTDADLLYAETAGIAGTHDTRALDVLWRVLSKGYDAFRQLDMDWANHIKGKGWSNEYLYNVMKSELKGVLFNEKWQIARAYLDSYENAKKLEDSKGKVSESVEIEMQIKAAENALTAAAGVGTNDQEVIRAAQLLQQAWSRRIELAKKNKDDNLRQLEEEWLRVRNRILNDRKAGSKSIRLDDQNTAQLRNAVGGANSIADQVYAAGRAGQYEQVQSLVTKAWASGQLEHYFNDAGKSIKDTDGSVIRPAFRADDIVPVNATDMRFMRIYALLDPRIETNAERGANRIKTEFEVKNNPIDSQAPADGDLADLLAFLTTAGIKPDLRESAVGHYMRQFQGYTASSAKKPSDAFLEILKRFDNGKGYNYQELLRILAPLNKQDVDQKVKRAQQRLASSRTGALSGVLHGAMKAKAAKTGSGDSSAFAEHQLQTMEFAGNTENARTDPSYGVLMQQSEKRTTADLVEHSEEQFDAAMAVYRAEEKEVADLIAGAVELAVELVASIATGGAQGGWAIASAVAALMAKYGAKEALLGTDYKLVSSENVQEIIGAVVASYLDEFADFRKRIAERIDFESTQHMLNWIAAGRENTAKMIGNAVQNLGAGVADQLVNSMTSIMTDAILRQKYPTAETFAAESYRIAFYSAARSLHAFGGTYKYNPGVLSNDLMSFQERLKVNFYFKELVKLFEGTGKKLADLAALDTTNMTWTEVLAKIGVPQIKSMGLTTPLKSMASAFGQYRRAKNRVEKAAFISKFDQSLEPQIIKVLMDSPDIQKSFYWHQESKRAAKEEPIATLSEYVKKKKKNDINQMLIDHFEMMASVGLHDEKSLTDFVRAERRKNKNKDDETGNQENAESQPVPATAQNG